MEVKPSSKWNLKPSPTQVRAITRLASQLGITEPIENTPTTRMEARNLIYRLRVQLKEKQNSSMEVSNDNQT